MVRLDSFGYPWVVTEKSYFVTSGTDRRSSGTHYTPRILTEPVVKHTLDPLVYVGPAEGLPEHEWKLKSAKEILELKVCDMACGSGAFLVEACRYLAARLMEAWAIERSASPQSVRTTPVGGESSGVASESIIPDDPREQEIYAMRLVAQRCLYGVDINPLAAEMAKLSLWLLTMSKDKPFEFLDHNIRSGDSLVGLSDLDQLRYYSLKPVPENEVLFRGPLDHAISEAIDLRLKLEDMPSNTVEDVQRQEELLKEATLKMAKLRYAADMLVSAEFWGQNAKDKLHRTQEASRKSAEFFDNGDLDSFKKEADKERNGQKMFHWPLEYPEVIVKRGGFDAFVGNPPFRGGTYLTGDFGIPYRSYLVTHIANNRRGNSDLCAYFLLRLQVITKPFGAIGIIATNTIAQGDTREVGLEQVAQSSTIRRAVPTMPWPGVASLEVSLIWLHKGAWRGGAYLLNNAVNLITPYLTSSGTSENTPCLLKSNNMKSFLGAKVYGQGFVLTPDEAISLIEKDGRNKDVIFPYIGGEELNTHPSQLHNRYVINFFDWAIEKAQDYTDCFKLIEEKVKPERMLLKDNPDGRRRKAFWWLFGRATPALDSLKKNMQRVLVTARVSPTGAIAFVSSNQVIHEKVVVFLFDDYGAFSILQSSLHWCWAVQYSSTLGATTLNYAPSDCFDSFPFVINREELAEFGIAYYDHRKQIMLARQEGLTKTYNRFHSPSESSLDIQKLRDLHVEMDIAVAAAYGWTDLNLDHGFHETKQGIRFTISEAARREVLQRLLKLNHERYAEEEKQGLHGKKKKAAKRAAPKKTDKPKATKKATKNATPMLDFGEDDE